MAKIIKILFTISEELQVKKEVVSDKQGISLIILLIIGASSVYISGAGAKENIWLAVIIAMLMVLPMVFISIRLHGLFPDKDLFDIIEICFGKLMGKIIILLYILFLIITEFSIIRAFSEFINTIALVQTPLIVSMISLCTLCIFAVKGGIELLGRFAELFVFIPIILMTIIILLLIPNMDINNLRPFLYEGIKPVLKAAFVIFSFPFCQIVILTMFFSKFQSNKSPYKIYLSGAFIGQITIFMTLLSVVLVVGGGNAKYKYYPTYEAISTIQVGSIERFEILPSIIFMIGYFIKISIHLIAICKGITKEFKCKDYKFIVTPVTVITIILAYTAYDSTMYFHEWDGEVWNYIAFPFQVIFPILMWIISEFKKNKFNNIKT